MGPRARPSHVSHARESPVTGPRAHPPRIPSTRRRGSPRAGPRAHSPRVDSTRGGVLWGWGRGLTCPMSPGLGFSRCGAEGSPVPCLQCWRYLGGRAKGSLSPCPRRQGEGFSEGGAEGSPAPHPQRGGGEFSGGGAKGSPAPHPRTGGRGSLGAGLRTCPSRVPSAVGRGSLGSGPKARLPCVTSTGVLWGQGRGLTRPLSQRWEGLRGQGPGLARPVSLAPGVSGGRA